MFRILTLFCYSVLWTSNGTKSGHSLCPSYRYSRCDATSIIASFSSVCYSDKWFHPLPSVVLLPTLLVLMFYTMYSQFCLLFALFALTTLAAWCCCCIHPRHVIYFCVRSYFQAHSHSREKRLFVISVPSYVLLYDLGSNRVSFLEF